MLSAVSGGLLYDRTWSWPLTAPATGIASLVQASRQLGGEINGGMLHRIVLEAPLDGGMHVAPIEGLLHTSGKLLGVLFQRITTDAPSGDANARRYLELLVLAFANSFPDVIRKLDDPTGAPMGGTRHAPGARVEPLSPHDAAEFDSQADGLLRAVGVTLGGRTAEAPQRASS